MSLFQSYSDKFKDMEERQIITDLRREISKQKEENVYLKRKLKISLELNKITELIRHIPTEKSFKDWDLAKERFDAEILPRPNK